MARYSGSGWHNQSIRHSNARKYGRAGGTYAVTIGGKPVYKNLTKKDAQRTARLMLAMSSRLDIFYKPMSQIDTDRDGVPDKYDCEPKNPRKQHKFTRVKSPIPLDELARELTIDLSRLGYEVNFTADGKKLLMSNVRLGDKKIEMEGYNISPYTGRRGRVLSWDNWVEVNNRINDVLDRHNVSANVNSLAGKFQIREGTKRFGEADWNEAGYDNVGSIISPVSRREAWVSEGIPLSPKKIKQLRGY